MIFLRNSTFVFINFSPLSCSNITKISRSFQSSSQVYNQGVNDKKCEYRDIVIAGGGMVGFSAACSLGLSRRLENKNILLLEKQSSTHWELPEEYSNRVCALNSNSANLLSQIGSWNIIKEMRAQPIKKMQVWEEKSEALITFDENDSEENLIGHIVENDVILESLKQVLPHNVEVSYGSHVVECHLPRSSDDKVQLTLDSGQRISCDLLIGADGHHSSIRSAMESKYLSWQYDQSAIVATLELSEEQDNFVAWQKFLSTGPIAILPLSSTRSSLVWSTTKKKCQELLALSECEFIDALNNAMWQDDSSVNPVVKSVHSRWQELLSLMSTNTRVLHGARQLPPSISKIMRGSLASFPLGLGHSANYVAPRVALIGDAAHRVHPLAGQGVNLGFGDVSCLTSVLEDAVSLGENIGEISHLRRFETTRQRHNVAVMASIDALYRLYATSVPPIVLLRSLGLSAVHSLPPIKKRIMALAEG